MRNQKVSSLLKLIGGALLAVSLFCLLSLSDVVRLHEALEGVPNGQLAGAAKDGVIEQEVEVLVSDLTVTEGMETDFAVEGALPELPADAQTHGSGRRHVLCVHLRGVPGAGRRAGHG